MSKVENKKLLLFWKIEQNYFFLENRTKQLRLHRVQRRFEDQILKIENSEN